MKLIKIFQNRKLILLNLFLAFYVLTNIVGGERGVFSYFEKKNLQEKLVKKELNLEKKLAEINNKNRLISEKVDLDFLDIIYRQELKKSKKDEIIIRLK
jgi:cell division protein DivIC